MIKINTERCNGCGECVEVCPTGALYLVQGKATVEQKLCRDCESCIAACPTEAIRLVPPKEALEETVLVPAPRPEPEVIQVKSKSAPISFRASVLPAVGGALAWGWREIVPCLAEYLLYDLDRRRGRRRTPTRTRNTPDSGSSIRGRGGGLRRRRRRRRGLLETVMTQRDYLYQVLQRH